MIIRNIKVFSKEDRKIDIGNYLISHKELSLVKLGHIFHISKSQAHRDLHDLAYINLDLYFQCKDILFSHKKL